MYSTVITAHGTGALCCNKHVSVCTCLTVCTLISWITFPHLPNFLYVVCDQMTMAES